MSNEMRIESRPAFEAYIGKRGHICLKMEDSMTDDIIITIPPGDVETVIGWLQALLKERLEIPDDEYLESEDTP